MELIKCAIEERDNESCIWKQLFDNNDRSILQEGIFLAGLLSVIFSLWLSVILLFSNLRYDKSYRNLSNFTIVECFRRAIPAFYHLIFIKYFATSHELQVSSCKYFGFFEAFLAVLEVECLTHVCIERYVVAKYITNGWKINQNHYKLYLSLCIFFSCLYSIPPLCGIGDYGYDFDCASCTFDMVLPVTWQRYFVVAIFLLRSVKPTIFMALMLFWARMLEAKQPHLMKKQHQFTKSAIAISVVNLMCWAPIAVIRASVVLSNFMFLDIIAMPTGVYVMWAMWIHWIAPVPSTIALVLVNDRVRNIVFSLFKENAKQKDDEKND